MNRNRNRNNNNRKNNTTYYVIETIETTMMMIIIIGDDAVSVGHSLEKLKRVDMISNSLTTNSIDTWF